MRLVLTYMGEGWVCVGLVLRRCAAAAAALGEATLVADAHVNSARPAVNSGALSNLNVGGGYTALLQFDLSMLPAGTTAAQVTRAVLRVYCNRVDTPGLVSVQPVAGAWGEYGVTYATLPGLGSAVQTVQVSQADAFVTVDVTALVQGWMAAPATNYGLALTAGTAVVQFDSKENDLTAHAAELEVRWPRAGAGGAGGTGRGCGAAGPRAWRACRGGWGLRGRAGLAGGYAGPSRAGGRAGSSFVSGRREPERRGCGSVGGAGRRGLPGRAGPRGLPGWATRGRIGRGRTMG